MIREINEPDFDDSLTSHTINNDSITLNISDLSNIQDESFMINDSKSSKGSKGISVTMHDFDSDFDSRPSEGCHYSEALIGREMERDTSNANILMNEILNGPEISIVRSSPVSGHSSSETDIRNGESDPPSEHSDQDELARSPSVAEGDDNGDIESQEYIRRAQHISPMEQNYIDRIALLRGEFDRRDSVRVAEIERIHHFYSVRIDNSNGLIKHKDRLIEEQESALREYELDKQVRESEEKAERERIAHDIMMLDRLCL